MQKLMDPRRIYLQAPIRIYYYNSIRNKARRIHKVCFHYDVTNSQQFMGSHLETLPPRSSVHDCNAEKR
jgi:hypothetical protein